MIIAEKLRQEEGKRFETGHEEEKIEIARNMLKNGMDIE